jgi:shikimate dehydrogenase
MRAGRLTFVGVSTSGSSVPRVMPGWSSALGVDIELDCLDLPIDVDASAYRGLLDRVRADADALGIIVTTHKALLWGACADQFDAVRPASLAVHEVSAIARRDGQLIADASDVLGVGRAVERLLDDDRWRAGERQALILGAGGAGVSLAYNLADRMPELGARRVVLTDADPGRLVLVREITRGWRHVAAVEVLAATGDINDRLVRESPPGTLVVNATGMGKDRPGSPISVDLPRRSIFWEFNYRGPRPLLQRARAQAATHDIAVADGRDYFVCGWLEALCSLLGRTATRELVDAFEREVAAVGI